MEFDDDFMMLLSLFIKKISMNEVMYKCIILILFVRNIIKYMFIIYCLLVLIILFIILDLVDLLVFKICWFYIFNFIKFYKI